MLNKRALGLVAVSLPVLALGFGCSDDEKGDGGSGAGGPLPPVVSNGGQNPVVIPGTGNAGSGGASTFDGGATPLTPEEAEVIRTQQCASWATEVEVVPTMLQLVVDISSSMNEKAPGAPDKSRWDIARAALLEAVVGVGGEGLPATVSAGLLLYPNLQTGVSNMPQDPGLCVNRDPMVPPDELGPADSAQRQRIRQGIEGAQLLQSTPTYDAYDIALNESLLPARFGGQKFMLLITDGEPTVQGQCWTESGGINGGVDPQPIVDMIERAATDEDVKTFLIGVPGSESNRRWMSEAAILGGTAPAGCSVDGGPNGNAYCHFDMTTAPDFAAALRAGLNTVLGVVSPCSFSFAEPPNGMMIDPTKINVLLNDGEEDTLIVRDDVDDCTEGWQLTSDNKILLCSDTCERVQSNPGITVDLTFGCKSFREPPIVE
jgi:hypothetical protein